MDAGTAPVQTHAHTPSELLLRARRENSPSRFETASAVGVEGNRSAGGVQPDQIDHRLEELQQRFWLTDAAAGDNTVVLVPPQCLHDATLSRGVQRDEALIGDQIRVLKAR